MILDLFFYILWGREIIEIWSHYLLIPNMQEFSWIALGVLAIWLSKLIRLPRILVWLYLGYRICFWKTGGLERRLLLELKNL
jgi:hypothetical protein